MIRPNYVPGCILWLEAFTVAVYSTVCYSKALNSIQGNPFTHPSKIRQQLWFSLSLSAHPPPSSSAVSCWWFMFRMAHVNQLLINPNGVNECQPGREWFAPALINMTSNIHTANHWLSDWETHTYTNAVAHLMLTLVLRVTTLDGGPNECQIACRILGRYTKSKIKY